MDRDYYPHSAPASAPARPSSEEIELIQQDIGGFGDLLSPEDSNKDEYKYVHRYSKFWTLYGGLVFSLLSSVFFSLCSVIVKYLNYIDPGELACLRFLGIFVLSTPIVIYKRENPLGPKAVRHLLIFRGLIGGASLYLRFGALHYLPIADASVIIFTVPVFVSILACLFLKEPCGVFQVFSVLATLIGMLMVIKLPQVYFNSIAFFEPDHIKGVSFASLSTLFGACVYIVVRKLKSLHYSIIMWNFGWVAIIESSVLTLISGKFSLPKCGLDKVIIILLGIFSFLGQTCLTLALKSEQAGPVSVVRSATDIILAFIWQYLFFGEIPDWYSILGGIVISLCIMLIGLRKWVLTLPENSRLKHRARFLLI